MPSVLIELFTLSASGKREKASSSGRGGNGELRAQSPAAETAELQLTVQMQVSPCRTHSIPSLTNRTALAIKMLSNSWNREGEKSVPLQKHIPAGITRVLSSACSTFSRSRPSHHPTQHGTCQHLMGKSLEPPEQLGTGNFTSGPETPAAFLQGHI